MAEWLSVGYFCNILTSAYVFDLFEANSNYSSSHTVCVFLLFQFLLVTIFGTCYAYA